MAENSEKRTYTVEEIKDILGISKPAAYNLIKKNEFRYVRVAGGKYRFPRKVLMNGSTRDRPFEPAKTAFRSSALQGDREAKIFLKIEYAIGGGIKMTDGSKDKRYMSVKEMGELLGLKKVESYWLGRRQERRSS